VPDTPFQRLRNQRGGITPAEGCMFGAVALFVILLLGILYVAFMRFGNPPPARPVPPPPAALLRSVPDANVSSTALDTGAEPNLYISVMPEMHG
jgi:hypothetical protein